MIIIGSLRLSENIEIPEFRLNLPARHNAPSSATGFHNAPRARKGFDWWNLVGLSTPTDERRIRHAARVWARLFPPPILNPTAALRATAKSKVATGDAIRSLEHRRLLQTGCSVWSPSATSRNTAVNATITAGNRWSDWFGPVGSNHLSTHVAAAHAEESDSLIELSVLNDTNKSVNKVRFNPIVVESDRV